MRHEVTFISDDIRHEVGRKVSLLGLYDQAIVFKTLPARLLKLAFYQRWLDVSNLSKVVLEIRGEPLGHTVFRVDGIPSEPELKGPHPARITLVIGPIDIMREWRLEFLTYFNEESSPAHTHLLQVTVDAELKLI
jgi:hypothetical protein